MEIRNSKNTNTGNINTGGGNIHLGDNYYKSLEYQELKEREEELSDALRSAQNDEKRLVYSERLNKTRNQIEQLKKDVISLAETFLDIKLDSERLQLAKKFFEEGKFVEAGGSMDSNEMISDLDELLEERKRLQEKMIKNEELLKENASEFLVLAKLTAINYDLEDRFDKTIEYYEKSFKAERNYENISSYATFLQIHDREIESEHYFNEAVEIVRKLVQENPLKYLLELAERLNSLGLIQLKLNKLDQAEKSYHEALKICRRLTDDDNNNHLIQLGKALHFLGDIYGRKYRYDEAKNFLEEALVIRRKLSKDNSKESLANLANTLNNLSEFLEDDKREVLFEEALEIYRKLSEENPDEYLGSYAHFLDKLGSKQYRSNRFDEGRQSCQKAILILRKLSETNPQQYLSDLASCLISYALNIIVYEIIHLKKSDKKILLLLEETDKMSHEALSIHRNLAKFNGESWLDELADSLFHVANIKVFQHKENEAEILFQEAIEIYRDLCKSNSIYMEQFAIRLEIMAGLFDDKNFSFDKTEAYFKESIGIFQKLVEDFAEEFLPILDRNLEGLEYLYNKHNKKTKAEEIRKKRFLINKNIT